MAYQYAGKLHNGEYINPCRFAKYDQQWVVEMALLGGDYHAVLDISDLPFVFNLPEALIGSMDEVQMLDLDADTKAPLYKLDYRYVPTWTYNEATGVQANWPSKSKTSGDHGGSKGLARRMFGLVTRKEKAIYRNKNNLDLRRANTYVKSTYEEAAAGAANRHGWPGPMKADDPSLRDFVVIESHPGLEHPQLNPYDVVEYQGTRFCRMRAKDGEEFFFDAADLPRILRVDGVIPTWGVTAATGGSEDGYVFATIKSRRITLHTYLKDRPPGLNDGMTVEHVNGNKWDNRQANLKPVPSSRLMLHPDGTVNEDAKQCAVSSVKRPAAGKELPAKRTKQ
jgi:hypothetical protein